MLRHSVGRSAAMVFAVCALTVAGCASSSTVAASQVESQIDEKVSAQVGEKPKSVRCPDDLDAKVGATLRCTLVDPRDFEYGVTVTATSVEGKNVNFDIKVDEQAVPGTGQLAVAKADVEEQAATELAAQVGRRPAAITCPSDLPARVGATLRCTLHDDGTTFGLTVTVTAVAGTDVKFDVKVDSQPS